MNRFTLREGKEDTIDCISLGVYDHRTINKTWAKLSVHYENEGQNVDFEPVDSFDYGDNTYQAIEDTQQINNVILANRRRRDGTATVA